jgi:subtilase family serine protease
VIAGPDLTVSALSAPTTGVAGGSVTVTDTVRNVGADIAGPSSTRFYLSLNAALDGSDILLNGTRSVAAVGPGATDSGSTTVTLPTGVSGIYYIIAVADGTNAVAESSESNNTLLRSITIGS